jgi:hypothetical protein
MDSHLFADLFHVKTTRSLPSSCRWTARIHLRVCRPLTAPLMATKTAVTWLSAKRPPTRAPLGVSFFCCSSSHFGYLNQWPSVSICPRGAARHYAQSSFINDLLLDRQVDKTQSAMPSASETANARSPTNCKHAFCLSASPEAYAPSSALIHPTRQVRRFVYLPRSPPSPRLDGGSTQLYFVKLLLRASITPPGCVALAYDCLGCSRN